MLNNLMLVENLSDNDLSNYNKMGEKELDLVYLQSLARQHKNVNVDDFLKFLRLIQKTGADPYLDEIYMVTRRDKNKVTRGTVMFSYHFLNQRAQNTGELEFLYAKTEMRDYSEINSIGEETEIKKRLCAVGICERKGKKPIEKVCWYHEFVPRDWNGNPSPNKIWKEKRDIMLEKCAMATVLRLQFPDYLSNMFIKEEMGQSGQNVLRMETEKKRQLKIVESNKMITTGKYKNIFLKICKNKNRKETIDSMKSNGLFNGINFNETNSKKWRASLRQLIPLIKKEQEKIKRKKTQGERM